MTDHLDPAVRHDMVLIFDVTDGNPNGDPDSGNRPRQDPETSHGLITDVSLKRKIRDTIALKHANDDRYQIFVQADTPLNETLDLSYKEAGAKKTLAKEELAARVNAARTWLLDHYYDIRMFGAVLSTGNTRDLGRLTGPMQLTMARSIDPIMPIEHAITRVTPTKADTDKKTEMGSKWAVPYGLYRAHIHYSGAQAAKTNVTAADLEAFYQAVTMMFDHTRSAGRGEMAVRGLWVYSHDDAFGRAPAHQLTQRIKVTRNPGVTTPRTYAHYDTDIDSTPPPNGITEKQVI